MPGGVRWELKRPNAEILHEGRWRLNAWWSPLGIETT